jgi:hypothetical protein
LADEKVTEAFPERLYDGAADEESGGGDGETT